MRLWGSGWAAPGAVFTACLLFSAGSAADSQTRNLTRVVYEFAVTSYCGTQNREVDQGFRAEVAAIMARDGLDEESAKRQRVRGWIQAEEEWRNRGLGGFRAWCQSEGLAAAHHFQAITRGERLP